MLILTRNVGERVIIGDDISVTIVGVNHQFIKGHYFTQVRMGFVAPDGVSIHREEIYRRIQNEQKELLSWQKIE